jgi:hypothetical protein
MTEDIIKLAIKNNMYGNPLQYVPNKLKTEEIVKLAVENNPSALEFVPV